MQMSIPLFYVSKMTPVPLNQKTNKNMKMKVSSEGFNALRLKMYLIIQTCRVQNDSMCTLRPRYDVNENTVGDNGTSLTKNRSAFPTKSLEIHSRLGVLDKAVADTENKDESRISTSNID